MSKPEDWREIISEEELESLGVFDDFRSGKSNTAIVPKAKADSVESRGYNLYDLLGHKPTLNNEAMRLLEEIHNLTLVN